MKKAIMTSEKFKFNSKIKDYLKSLFDKATKLKDDVWKVAKTESEETMICLKLINKVLKGGELTPKEKLFFKEQSKDLARILPIIMVSSIPVPIPITPFLILFGKKIGLDLIPKDNRHLLSSDELQIQVQIQEKNVELDVEIINNHFVLELESKIETEFVTNENKVYVPIEDVKLVENESVSKCIKNLL